MTIREQVKQIIANYDDDKLEQMLVKQHTGTTHEWIEVYPDGDVHEAEEADDNTTHWIEYPKKAVATLYDICHPNDCQCDCDDCTMYERFEEMTKEEFIDRYDEDVWEYCNTTSYEESIIDTNHDNGIYADDVRQWMLDNLGEIEQGYFDDEE